MHLNAVLALALLFAATAHSYARLGETEAQSQARYGTPSPDLIGPAEQPLLVGAKELAYKHEDWRVRVAFVGGRSMRLEYAKIPDAGGLRKLTPQDVEIILEAEKGTYRWREEKPRTGFAELNALKTVFDGRVWERSDHALARMKMDLVLTVESRDVAAYEKKMTRQGARATATPVTAAPKF